MHGVNNPCACGGSVNVAVKEGVSIGSGVVGVLAKGWVLLDGNESVDSDDVDRVGHACSRESSAGSADGCDNGLGGGRARVDKLVTDRDGVNVVPSTVLCVDCADNRLNLRLDCGDVVDASHDLHALGGGGGKDVGDLVAVHTVDTDDIVARESINFGSDVRGSLAANVTVLVGTRVWGV